MEDNFIKDDRQLVIACEHVGNEMPQEYRQFEDNPETLGTHRGIDIGTLELTITAGGNYFYFIYY